MKFEKIILGYYSILFMVFGLVGFSQPNLIADLVHLSFKSDMGYLDFVAMNGGLFLGVGVFMLYCVKENIKTGLVCVLCTMGFMLVARVYKYTVVGEADLIQYIYLGGELFSVVLMGALLYFGKEKASNVGAMA